MIQIPYLPKFRQTFPNVENFEFLETDIHSLDQLNAMAQVQVGRGLLGVMFFYKYEFYS